MTQTTTLLTPRNHRATPPDRLSSPATQPQPAAPPAPALEPARTRVRPRLRASLPAALEWRDTSLPGLGLVRASGWVPAMLMAACAVALVYLIQTSGVATTGYDIQRLQSERSEWQLRNEQLTLELTKLKSLTWVEAEATARLGMVRADQPVYLRAQVPSRQ